MVYLGKPNRFRRALKDLSLALVNATLILTIVAALSVGWAVHAVLNVAETAAERTTVAVLSASGLKPAEWHEQLAYLNDELTALRRDCHANPKVAEQLSRLSTQIATIEMALTRLSEPGTLVDGEVWDQILFGIQSRVQRIRQSLEQPKT